MTDNAQILSDFLSRTGIGCGLLSRRDSMRGEVNKVEKSIKDNTGRGKSINPGDADALLQVCDGIRTVLRFGGKLPFEPPGLRGGGVSPGACGLPVRPKGHGLTALLWQVAPGMGACGIRVTAYPG